MREDPSRFDVIIIGGGVVGCSTAFHLLRSERQLRLAIVEKDSTYQFASSALSVGNVRVQFSLPENIRVSLHTLELLKRFGEEMAVDGERPAVDFKSQGNLILTDAAGEPRAREDLVNQTNLGCRVQWLSGEEIESRFPLLRTGSCRGGSYGVDDGHLDGFALLMAYRRQALHRGAWLIEGEVASILQCAGKIRGVGLRDGRQLDAPVVVNCAGAWAAPLLETVGVDLPVVPKQRQVFLVEPEVKPESPLPLVKLPSGLYFRSEGEDLILVGRSFAEDPEGIGFAWQESRFSERLWPELARVVPAFERLRFFRGWTGLYAVNTLDGNAILGAWPGLAGLFVANGFSGHGLQQAPAVGRYLAESILGQQYSLDLSRLGPERILAGEPLTEAGLV